MPGNFRKISNEEKSSVIDAMQRRLDQGWTFNSAYNQVKADFLAGDKSCPTLQTVRSWFKPAAAPSEAPSAPSDPAPSPCESVSVSESPCVPESSDYTHRLELICKLYRTRSEACCDAICDELLPELLTQEE